MAKRDGEGGAGAGGGDDDDEDWDKLFNHGVEPIGL
jgi:hypothetical protein